MFCPYCGSSLNDQVNFCPNCGAQLKDNVSAAKPAASAGKANAEYSLVLVSRGSCPAAVAGDLLEDIFGYSDSAAASLVREAPVVVGQNLTAEEAAYVAQMFSEYGIEVSVLDRDEQYADLSSNAVKSVFDSSGNLLSNVLAVIGGLSIANRVTHYRRVRKPSLLERLFRPMFTPQRPPVHKRHIRIRPETIKTGFRPIPPRPNYGYRNSSDHVSRPDRGHRGGPGGRPGMMKKGR